MHTIFLDGGNYATPRELHAALKDMLGFPAHYGHNADALWDCLQERTEPLRVIVTGMGEGEAARAMQICLNVFEDAGAEVEIRNS